MSIWVVLNFLNQFSNSAHASQRNVVVLEFGSPCPPRSPSWTHDSHHDQQRIFPFSYEVFHLQRWTFRFHEQNVFENCLTHYSRQTWQQVAPFAHVSVQRWNPFCLQMNVFGLHLSHERVFPEWVPVTSRPVRSEELGSSQKEWPSISRERDVFLSSCTPITSCMISSRTDLSRIGFGVVWFDWKRLDSCPASARWGWFEPNSRFQSCFNEIFGRGRGEMYTFS